MTALPADNRPSQSGTGRMGDRATRLATTSEPVKHPGEKLCVVLPAAIGNTTRRQPATWHGSPDDGLEDERTWLVSETRAETKKTMGHEG